MKKTLAIVAFLSVALLAPSVEGQDQSTHAFLWTAGAGMQDLGTLGGSFSQATGINPSGQVVGYSYLADEQTYHAFVWTSLTGMQDLGTLGGANSVAVAVNGRGQIVGYSTVTAGSAAYHAFLWTGGHMRDLGTLGGDSSNAEAINDYGLVVGAAQLPNGNFHPMMWTLSGGMKDLGTLGGCCGSAFGDNYVGEIVGTALTARAASDPFSWTPTGGMEDLTPHHFYNSGNASAVNRPGIIAGWVNTTNSFPAIWSASGAIKILPVVGYSGAIAIGINGRNQVVGYHWTGAGVKGAFQWAQATGVTELGTLGGFSSEAFAINSVGQVVGWSNVP